MPTETIPAAIEAAPPLVTQETTCRAINGVPHSRARKKCRETGREYWVYVKDGIPVDDARGFPGAPYVVLGDNNLRMGFASFERSNRFMPFDLGESDPLGDELKRLGSDYPLIAAMIGKDHKPPGSAIKKGLFDLGSVSVEMSCYQIRQLSRDELIVLLQKHVNGDLGMYGKITPGRPPCDDLFLPIGLSNVRKSAVAIHDGEGIVVSRYPLWSDADTAADAKLRAETGFHATRKDYHRLRTSHIDIVTLIDSDKTRTLVSADSTANLSHLV